jgi:hypothetical protein
MKRAGLHHRYDDDATAGVLSSAQRLLLPSQPLSASASTSSSWRESQHQPIHMVRAACKRRRNHQNLQPHNSARLYGAWIVALLAVSCFSLYLSTSVASRANWSLNNSADGSSSSSSSLPPPSLVLIGSLSSASGTSSASAALRRGDGRALSPLNAMRAMDPAFYQQQSQLHPTIKNKELLRSRTASISRPAIAWLVSFPNSVRHAPRPLSSGVCLFKSRRA